MRRIAAVLLVLLVAACADDGRTLRPPASGATAPSTPSTAAVAKGSKDNAVIQTTAPVQSSTPRLTLTSTAFTDGDTIPATLGCDGASPLSPPLAWSGVPPAAAEMAISVIDPDADNFVHWVVAGIDPAVQSLATGAVPESAVQLTNSAGTAGWTPPCPPTGSKPHRYLFMLYALGQRSAIAPSTPLNDALAILSADAFDTTTLAATFQR